MRELLISYIATSLENGILKKIFIDALKDLSKRTTNTVDDTIVTFIENTLNNKEIDLELIDVIQKSLEKIK